jgi:hypothetical protein
MSAVALNGNARMKKVCIVFDDANGSYPCHEKEIQEPRC